MDDSGSHTAPRHEVLSDDEHGSCSQASNGDNAVVHVLPGVAPFLNSVAAHPCEHIHPPPAAEFTRLHGNHSTAECSAHDALVAPHPDAQVGQETADVRSAPLRHATESGHYTQESVPHSPDPSLAESRGYSDLGDSIEEDELYRSLADNELAVVPYGITLERYLAQLIFKCDSDHGYMLWSHVARAWLCWASMHMHTFLEAHGSQRRH